MHYFDPGYFKPSSTSSSRGSVPLRSITERLIAWELDHRYYDGDRSHGYGGYDYQRDRWHGVVRNTFIHFELGDGCSVLDIGCKKGFFGRAVIELFPNCEVIGIENHSYPVECNQAPDSVELRLGSYYDLNSFADQSFDLVWSFSAIYMQSLGDVVKTLREFERVGKNKFVTLGAFADEQERARFKDWTLIGTTSLSESDWIEVMEWSSYSGDYFFTTPRVLGLA